MRATSSKTLRKLPLALTAELVARVERKEPDPGPLPGRVYLSEADYDALTAELIAARLHMAGIAPSVWSSSAGAARRIVPA